ncbi:Peptidoglycan-binding lysin domain protein [Desulfarculus baarsii DSM 2075]|uniref:Peptidoglycan-binding lysin domain protein n=1 Tax=Desulfarculus baarsii (strain ATCC 33931 / DSM 2075 / LMG 7858 / VKM B-1802 / 2st14) TaxID=644282 RepID=E1QJM9_DESB2|nr:LysM peptidoglycan-binding domain-containing protein [Desulfarculus baarsii]ADK85772.1 Peptidoglycan-binding lysin domain protein [Desulfarculus baarsii DSM 2075]
MNDRFTGNGPGLDASSPSFGADGPSLDSGDFSPRQANANPLPPAKPTTTPPPLGLVALACSVAALLLSLFTLWLVPGEAPAPPPPPPQPQNIVGKPPQPAQMSAIAARLGRLEQQVVVLARGNRPAADSGDVTQLRRQIQQLQAAVAELSSRPASQPKRAAKAKAESAPSAKSVTHTVRRGQTLTAIATQYGVSVADLKKWNNIKGQNILIGQKLTINKAR